MFQDEEDEFEHLQDDEEFEGFDNTHQSKPSKGQDKQPDLKVAKVKYRFYLCGCYRVNKDMSSVKF